MTNKIQSLIENITKYLTDKYTRHPSAPSLILSWLGDKWYVSINKYGRPYGQDKQLLFAVEGNDLENLLVRVGKHLVEEPQKEVLKKTLQDLVYNKDFKVGNIDSLYESHVKFDH